MLLCCEDANGPEEASVRLHRQEARTPCLTKPRATGRSNDVLIQIHHSSPEASAASQRGGLENSRGPTEAPGVPAGSRAGERPPLGLPPPPPRRPAPPRTGPGAVQGSVQPPGGSGGKCGSDIGDPGPGDRARPIRVRPGAGPSSPRGRRARRPLEPQVVPRAGPFLLPLSFLSPPLPLARCRRHFPRFLLPLQSGGREGVAGSFLPPCKLQRDSRLQLAAAPPARELLLELPLAARPGSPGGWKVAAGRQAAAARTLRSPSPRLPGRPPLPSSPPARRSVPPARLAAPRRAGDPPALGAPPPPGLFFVLDADSRPAQTGAGLSAALPRRSPRPCPSTRGPWSPRGCAGPRRPGRRARRSSARWSRSARTPWSACWRSSPTCRAAPGTSSASSRARRPPWAAAPPRCTAASTPCTPPPRASTTAE
ncbi:basic proline-rich protein-like [Cervus canadensis]|uniref:basic proline-rich protein-like n=1 Tax=Cervus canadensis TaxID=1574408 RepID=UPI001CA303CC|nr:basic proline-rich protein-like [Cervus canadensis]